MGRVKNPSKPQVKAVKVKKSKKKEEEEERMEEPVEEEVDDEEIDEEMDDEDNPEDISADADPEINEFSDKENGDDEDEDEGEDEEEDEDDEEEEGIVNGVSGSSDRVIARRTTGFWGSILSRSSPKAFWDLEGGAALDETDCVADPDFVELTLNITHFAIDYKTGTEPQCIQVKTNYENDNRPWFTLAYLNKHSYPCHGVQLSFSAADRPVAFRLAYGEGPVTIAGQIESRVNEMPGALARHLKEALTQANGSEDDDDDDNDEDDDDDEEEEEEEEEAPKHIAIRSAPTSRGKRPHISPATTAVPPPKKAKNASNGRKK